MYLFFSLRHILHFYCFRLQYYNIFPKKQNYFEENSIFFIRKGFFLWLLKLIWVACKHSLYFFSIFERQFVQLFRIFAE